MKKINYLLLLLMGFVMSFAFVSCGDDDETPSNTTTGIAGTTWQVVDKDTTGYMTFNNDGTAYIYATVKDTLKASIKVAYTYTEGKLSVTAYGSTQDYTTTLSGSTLKISGKEFITDASFTGTYTKLDKSPYTTAQLTNKDLFIDASKTYTADDLVGTWTATETETVANKTVKVTLTFVFTKDGTYNITSQVEGSSTSNPVNEGKFSISGNILKFTYTSDSKEASKTYTFMIVDSTHMYVYGTDDNGKTVINMLTKQK